MRRRDFKKVYGREPSEEELRVFCEYVELVKAGRRLARSWETTENRERVLKVTKGKGGKDKDE